MAAIFRDALAVFAADPYLRLLPALMLAALAHCFIERSAGRPAGLAEGIGRMLARLPRLLASYFMIVVMTREDVLCLSVGALPDQARSGVAEGLTPPSWSWSASS